jgi:hypothetical protein
MLTALWGDIKNQLGKIIPKGRKVSKMGEESSTPAYEQQTASQGLLLDSRVASQKIIAGSKRSIASPTSP